MLVVRISRLPSSDVVRPMRQGVFEMPVFKPDFCKKLLLELENFSKTDLPRNQYEQ